MCITVRFINLKSVSVCSSPYHWMRIVEHFMSLNEKWIINYWGLSKRVELFEMDLLPGKGNVSIKKTVLEPRGKTCNNFNSVSVVKWVLKKFAMIKTMQEVLRFPCKV